MKFGVEKMKPFLEISDFSKLNKVWKLNQSSFNPDKGYKTEAIKKQVKENHYPVREKMKLLMKELFQAAYFSKRFDITLSKPNKQTNQFKKGEIQHYIWISLVDKKSHRELGAEQYKHIKLPQLQVTISRDNFSSAIIWLDSAYCPYQYKIKLFNYLQKHPFSSKYKIEIYDTKESSLSFFGNINNLSTAEINNYTKHGRYNIGFENLITPKQINKLGDGLFTKVVDDLQSLNDNVFTPCFGYKTTGIKNEITKKNTKGRRAVEKIDIKESLRRGTKPVKVNRLHAKIQNQLTDYLRAQYPGSVVKLEEDFVDIKVELHKEKKIILYEVKTSRTALNCIKDGLGQLLFYSCSLQDDWKRVELIIVGPHKTTQESKEFEKSVKGYLKDFSFRYQPFYIKK